jgi:two-component system response regulator YesN
MGLQLIEDTLPDIVITDIKMPYMDGLEMIEVLNKMASPIHFIVLSGYSDFQYTQKGIQLGINNFILKPVDEQELENSILATITRIEARRHEKAKLADLQAQSMLYAALMSKQTLSDDTPEELNRVLPPFREQQGKPQQQSGMIQDIKKYIDEHYTENISIVSAAEHFYLNPSYLSQLFKKKTDDTFLNYVTNTRLEKAKSLLQDTDLKVYEISSQVGYKDPKYFSKIFEKKIGVKPSDYKLNPYS